MVIGEEDGSDSFSDDRAATTAAVGGCGVGGVGGEGESGQRGRAWGRWVWMRSGRVQSEVALEEGGACLARGRGAVRGRDAGGGFRCVSREGGFRTRRERGVRVGARREERGVAFHLADGVLRERGATATATATARATGQDGDRQRQHPRRGRHRRLLRHGQQRRPRRRGPDSDDGDSRGRGLSAETWRRDSTERFEGAVGDEVRDRGQQQRQGRRQQLQRRGRQRQHQRRPGTATTARTGTATTATATAGAMASCVEGTSRATSERGPHRRQQRRMAAPSSASTVRRRRDPDRVRDGPRRGSVAWRGHAVGDTSRASKCLGALELQRERVGWVGRAGDTPRLPSADCSGRRVWERAHHRFVGIGVTRLISNKS